LLVREVFDVRHLRHVQHYAVLGSGLQLLNSYAAAKKSRQKKAGSHRQPVVSHPGLRVGTAQHETCPRTNPVSDTGLIHPTPHCVRRGRVCKGRHASTPAPFVPATEFRRGLAALLADGLRGEKVMPDGGARSATLERMMALSLTFVARGLVLSWAVSGGGPGWLTTGWRLQPAFFCLLFFAAAKKSRCRPAQGRS
jgi:hypothetical protein